MLRELWMCAGETGVPQKHLFFFIFVIIYWPSAGPPRAVSGPSEKKRIVPSPSKGGPAKNLYTKSERVTLSCRVNWAWSERVSLYN